MWSQHVTDVTGRGRVQLVVSERNACHHRLGLPLLPELAVQAWRWGRACLDDQPFPDDKVPPYGCPQDLPSMLVLANKRTDSAGSGYDGISGLANCKFCSASSQLG